MPAGVRDVMLHDDDEIVPSDPIRWNCNGVNRCRISSKLYDVSPRYQSRSVVLWGACLRDSEVGTNRVGYGVQDKQILFGFSKFEC